MTERKSNNSVDFLKQVLGMVEWVKEGGSVVSDNLAVKNLAMENKLEMALSQLQEKDEELRLREEEKFKLEENCTRLQTQVENLQGQLEREKWERCHAEINLRDMAREMARVYERIDEVIKIAGENEEDSENEEEQEIQVIGVKRRYTEGHPGFEKMWRKLSGFGRRIGEKWKKCEEFEQETRKELEKAKGFVEEIKKLIKQKEELEKEGKKMEAEKVEEIATPQEAQVATTSQEPENFKQNKPQPLNLMEVDTNLEKDSDAQNNNQMEVEPSSALLTPPEQPTVQENSTLTLTFHRRTPSPPPRALKETEKCESPKSEEHSSYPASQVEFFKKLLGLPVQSNENLEQNLEQETSPNSSVIRFAQMQQPQQIPSTPTPPVSPANQKPPGANNQPITNEHGNLIANQKPPSTHNQPITVEHTNYVLPANQKPPGTISQPIKSIEHGVDPNKRHLGFFCLCGLECSTKKTLQYHLQYLQSGNSRMALLHQQQPISQEKIPQNHQISTQDNQKNRLLIEQLRQRPQIPSPKKCRKCGKMYTGGKDGLRRHILEEHRPQMMHGYQRHKLIRQDNLVDHSLNIPANQSLFTEQQHQNHPAYQQYSQQQQFNIPQNELLLLQCNHCPELFRTMVQLKLHQKVRHSTHIPQQHPHPHPKANWKNVHELIS